MYRREIPNVGAGFMPAEMTNLVFEIKRGHEARAYMQRQSEADVISWLLACRSKPARSNPASFGL